MKPSDLYKYILIGSCIFCLSILNFIVLSAQSRILIQGSIGVSTGNTDSTMITIYGKSSQNLQNAVFENINICISIPDQGIDNPVVNINRNFMPSLDWTYAGTNFPDVINGRAYYTFISNDNESNAKLNWPENVESPIVEFKFKGGQGRFKVQLNDLTTGEGVGSGGGPSSQSFWYVQVNVNGDVTNYQDKFFKNNTSQSPVNGGLYASSYVETINDLVLPAVVISKVQWELFPNPTSNRIHVIPGVNGMLNFRFLNLDGKLLTEHKLDVLQGQAVTFDLAQFNPGMYLLEAFDLKNTLLFSRKVNIKR